MTGMDIEIAPLGTDADNRFGWIRASIDEEPQDQMAPWGSVAYLASCYRERPIKNRLCAHVEDAEDFVATHVRDTGHPAGWAYVLWRPAVPATV